jgi:hypothetical protein
MFMPEALICYLLQLPFLLLSISVTSPSIFQETLESHSNTSFLIKLTSMIRINMTGFDSWDENEQTRLQRRHPCVGQATGASYKAGLPPNPGHRLLLTFAPYSTV